MTPDEMRADLQTLQAMAEKYDAALQVKRTEDIPIGELDNWVEVVTSLVVGISALENLLP